MPVPYTSVYTKKPPKDSLVDEYGRQPCHAFAHGKCTFGDQCKWGHGPQSEAMIAHRKKVEAKNKGKDKSGGGGHKTKGAPKGGKADSKAVPPQMG